MTTLLEHFDFYVMPVMNVDGYEYTWSKPSVCRDFLTGYNTQCDFSPSLQSQSIEIRADVTNSHLTWHPFKASRATRLWFYNLPWSLIPSLACGLCRDTSGKSSLLAKWDAALIFHSCFPWMWFLCLFSQNRLWRKSRSSHSNSGCIGTDMNRNFDAHWCGMTSFPFCRASVLAYKFCHFEKVFTKRQVHLNNIYKLMNGFSAWDTPSQNLQWCWKPTFLGSQHRIVES